MADEKFFAKNEKVITASIEDQVRDAYLDYSMSVIVGRALPNGKDGLKPVHRRILFAMHDMGLHYNKAYKKSARVVGEVLGKYHPHGDLSVYDALVRMAQNFSMRYPLVDGQGNFGSIDGDNAAAMRYTEVRLTALAEEMLADIQKDTVDFRLNFDESLEEPVVLPSKIPTMILNGASGIAVGMATNIPPHNLREVAEGIKYLIDHPDAKIKELMKIIPAPDFPTGATICGRSEILRAYTTGRGLIKVRAKAGVEEVKGGKENIVITEIPYMVNKSTLLEKMADLVQNKVIPGISDIRDESDRDGLRVVIETKRGEPIKVILNQLYKHTQMQTTFGVNLLIIDKGVPKTVNLKELLECHVNHRRNVIVRRSQYELRIAENRAHILEGFKTILSHIDQVVKTIRSAKDRADAKEKLMKKFKLSERQTDAILEMRLYQLTGLERKKIEEEYLEIIKRIAYLKSILASDKKILGLIKVEMDEIIKKFADERRTDIVEDLTNLKIEDLIVDETAIITVTHSGYIKRTSLDLYRQQRRGGKGVSGMETREEDFVEDLFIASTHDYLLVFTENGRVYWLKVYEIPQAGRYARGKAIVNLLELKSDEKIATTMRVRDFTQNQSVVMVTQNGTIKKTALSLFSRPRRGGIVAITINEKDRLEGAKLLGPEDDLFLATRMGMSIRFHAGQIRDMGRTAQGVRGIRLGKKGDGVVGMEIFEKDGAVLIVTERGYGKRTRMNEYRVQGRGGKGIITMKTKERNGQVVGALSVKEDDEVMMISTRGKMIRTKVSGISVIGRNTQGVRLISLGANDKLVAVSSVIAEKADEVVEQEKKEEEKATVSTKTTKRKKK